MNYTYGNHLQSLGRIQRNGQGKIDIKHYHLHMQDIANEKKKKELLRKIKEF